MARNKEGNSKFRNRNNEILFIDARELGTMISRKQKELSDKDIAKISDTYHNWRSKTDFEANYKDIAGFCKSANIQDVRKNNYILTPGRYIDFKETKDDFNFAERFTALKAEFEKQLKEEARLNVLIKENLDKIKLNQ